MKNGRSHQVSKNWPGWHFMYSLLGEPDMFLGQGY